MRQQHEADPEVANGQRWSVTLSTTCSPCSQAASLALGGGGGRYLSCASLWIPWSCTGSWPSRRKLPTLTRQPVSRGQEGSRRLTFEPLPWRLGSGPVVGTQGARCYSLILKGAINSQMPSGCWLRPLCPPCICTHCHLLPRPSCLSSWLHSMPHSAPLVWSLPFPPYYRVE